MKKILIILVVWLTSIQLFGDSDKQGFRIVLNTSLGSCPKCVFLPLELINNISDSVECEIEFTVEAAVRCNRDKELKIFKDRYNWKYKLSRDDGSFTRKYNPQNEYDIFIFKNEKLLSKHNSLSDDHSKIVSEVQNIFCKN